MARGHPAPARLTNTRGLVFALLLSLRVDFAPCRGPPLACGHPVRLQRVSAGGCSPRLLVECLLAECKQRIMVVRCVRVAAAIQLWRVQRGVCTQARCAHGYACTIQSHEYKNTRSRRRSSTVTRLAKQVTGSEHLRPSCQQRWSLNLQPRDRASAPQPRHNRQVRVGRWEPHNHALGAAAAALS